MAIPPITYFERFKARFPGAYRGLFTLIPLLVAWLVTVLLSYPPEVQWPVPELATARYEAAWLVLFGVCMATPLWVAQRHPHGWWKALLPALLILGQCTWGLVCSYGPFHPTDVGAMGSAILLGVCFGIYALVSIPLTGVAALFLRR